MDVRRRAAGAVLFDIFNHMLQIFLIVLCMYPFYYLFIYSLSEPAEASRGIYLLPTGFTLKNYMQVLELPGILRATFVSVARTVLGTLLSVTGCMLYAYILTKKELPFRKVIYRMTVITMYVGGGLIPTYIVLKSYGFINSFWVYVIPGAIGAFNVVLAKTYIEQLPEVLEESAMIDGAGYFTCFFKIVMPLSKAIVATIALFVAVGQWNAWFDNYLYVFDSDKFTLQYILYMYLTQVQNTIKQLQEGAMSGMSSMVMTPEAVRVTITMLVTIPVILVYPFVQKHFVKGIMIGAVKG